VTPMQWLPATLRPAFSTKRAQERVDRVWADGGFWWVLFKYDWAYDGAAAIVFKCEIDTLAQGATEARRLINASTQTKRLTS